jgi:hypothetical protein
VGRTRKVVGGALAATVLVLVAPAAADAQAECRRAVVFTLPGVSWADVNEFRPPTLLQVIDEGAVGSISVRTISTRTSYRSGYSTIGAGARVDALPGTGFPSNFGTDDGILQSGAEVDISVIKEVADAAGYGARPGALGSSLDAPVVAIGNSDLGNPYPAPTGAGRWTLLAAMDTDGVVDLSATGPELLTADEEWPFGARTDEVAIEAAVDAAFEVPCANLIVDQGDLVRADSLADVSFSPRNEDRRRALLAADGLLAHIRDQLDPERDLLLVVSPTSPAWQPFAELGVAVAVGPGFDSGSTLETASTRRRGVVTLPDIAPTILEHLGLDRPASMNGRPWFSVAAADEDRIGSAIDLNEESVFVDGIKSVVSGWFVVCQVIVYLLALGLLAWREARARNRADPSGPGPSGLAIWLERAALALVAFPISTFFMGIFPAHDLGAPIFVLLLLGIDAALVIVAMLVANRPLDRLLVVCAFTLAAITADLVTGSRLQLNTVFGYSPIVAGRFAGAGNIAFAVLGASSVLTGALIVHRWPTRRALAAVVAMFAVVIVIDGAPPFGSDVGGVIALVPALAITAVLLSGRRPSLKLLVLGAIGALVALAAFAAIDLARPSGSRTHLGRMVEDIQARGFSVLTDTISRKAKSNLRVFRSTIWTFFVPPALAAMAWFLARPRGRWGRLAEIFPKLRAGLVGGLIVAVLGFAVNDSGIVIPAVVLSFLVPMALLVHLVLEMEEELPADPEPALEGREPRVLSGGRRPKEAPQ